ncbi:DUF2207 domain-containing protein [Dokdonella sp.]|uniref:DUF2207 domain-containing protein n=1 Tax=Dokdonella sp. TaxID=2291710 RepID=UPI001B293E62|nr:DUF2207 domain-containing protein [Dokdonella sp.]MBO9664475.1 DUF2207 domain-containing protein [Dokdonella sp.]
MTRAGPLVLGWLVALLAWPLAAMADERILSFHSAIDVAADGGMDVTETVRVRAEGRNIRHGIYRDFPTDYRDRFGNAVRVAFEPRALTRDGRTEPFHVERQFNGVRVYFGSKDTTLAPGEYTWSFGYHTNRQLGFFADHDELYWNVTGNGWDFPIDEAVAIVALPGAVARSDLRLDAYTGPDGARGADWTARADGDSRAVFATTRPLDPREGLTIAVSFPKGLVAAPGERQRVAWFLGDNAGVLALAAGLLLVLAYYLAQWSRVGRDPKPGTIIPQYEPPAGHTPGALRYVERMGWDNRCVAADLVDAAVRGTIRIADDDGDYRIERVGDAALPPVESRLVADLLAGAHAFTFEQSQHARVAKALDAHRKALKTAYADSHFRTNTGLVVIGVLITLAAVVGAALLVGDAGRTAGAAFMLIWLGGWSVGVFALCSKVVSAWRTVRRGSLGKRAAATIGAIFITVFALPFVAGELFGIGMLVMLAGVGFAIAIVALIATNLLFAWLMRAPTATGRDLLDRIDGLRLYLGVAERDELAAQKAPPVNAEEFHRLLPYALALDVEENWTNRFAAAVGPAAAAAAVAGAGWYHGASGGDFSGFASDLGASFGSAISSSSSAPGSSSGGGGGGSSGGGGGGGGGGGW